MSSLFDRIGGYDTLKKVHRLFYDKIYGHEWLGQFFFEIDQTMIESQQTDFMAQAMGGPQMYKGAFPVPAHQHMFITSELFDLRHELLRSSLLEAGVERSEAEAWLKIDASFKKSLVKESVASCQPRFKTDEILAFKKPTSKLNKVS